MLIFRTAGERRIAGISSSRPEEKSISWSINHQRNLCPLKRHPRLARLSTVVSHVIADWRRVTGFDFQLPIYQITHLPMIMAFSLFFSLKHPHPGIRGLLLQTKAQVPFNSLMTVLSKPLFFLLLPSVWPIAECH
jgi:hypothetical protein